MKKTYMNPVMDVMEIKVTNQLLAESLIELGTGDVLPTDADARILDFDEGDDLSLFLE